MRVPTPTAPPSRQAECRPGRIVLTSMLLAVLALLGGCATAPATASLPPGLFQDEAFRPATVAVTSPRGLFALDPAMRRYLQEVIATEVQRKGRQQGLLDGLYQKQKLLLEYDSTVTRTASEAFAARSGNCLSLVILTAAFAKELGLPVRYQSVTISDHWARSGDMLILAGHVNLSLGEHRTEASTIQLMQNNMLTVDFVPPEYLRALRDRVIDEATVVAMYYNNRATECIHAGRLDDAYWMARAAIEQDPRFHGAFITLGCIYRRHGDLAAAERVLRHVLQAEPDNVPALGNLAVALQVAGRMAEVETLKARLAKLQPFPPYAFFDQGLKAMQAGDYRKAQDLFQREVNRDAYASEFHFWLAIASYKLGDLATARRHMQAATEYSTTIKDRGLYAAKLAYLQAARPGTPSH